MIAFDLTDHDLGKPGVARALAELFLAIGAATPSDGTRERSGPLAAAAELDQARVDAALRAAGGNRAETARLLGMSRATFYRRARELELRLPRRRAEHRSDAELRRDRAPATERAHTRARLGDQLEVRGDILISEVESVTGLKGKALGGDIGAWNRWAVAAGRRRIVIGRHAGLPCYRLEQLAGGAT